MQAVLRNEKSDDQQAVTRKQRMNRDREHISVLQGERQGAV